MELKKEKSFPRGGKKPALFKSNRTSTFSFLKKPKTKPKKKSKKINQLEKAKRTENTSNRLPEEGFSVKYVEDLKPSIIQDGMLVLGIVSKVTDRIATVSLPGGLRAAITLVNAPEFYKNLIENSNESSEIPAFQEILKPGDIIPVKVLSASDNHHSLLVTCDPKIINEKLTYNFIEEGFILVGSVKSEEEHGFIIDFGIEHVQGFLKHENINENQTLKKGQLVRCCVKKCTISPGSCRAELSVLKKDLQSATIKKNSKLPVFCYIPGFQFEVTVKKILSEGVEVTYKETDSTKGFIHENYFLKKFSNPSDMEIGDKITGTLLYVKPFVNFLYFKIMPKKELKWPFQYGEIVSGKVVKLKRHGVIFKISKGSESTKCFVPLSKLKNGGSKAFEEKSDILNLFPINKTVSKIRLGHVDWMARYYLGATDKASIMEKYYSISDLKCGDLVTCKITGFGKSFTHVEIGRGIKGIVAFTDMTDAPMKNPTKKFSVGQKVKGRVLQISVEKVSAKLTMKPTLLKEKNILCSFNKCKKNNTYTGTIVKVMDNKIIVKFFNQILGLVPKHLTPYPDSKSLTGHYVKGQLVKCNVVELNSNKRILLSLLSTNGETQLEVGKKYKVEVLNKTERGLFLEVTVDEKTKSTGYLPSALLATHQSLVSALHATYTQGEKFYAYCIINNIKNEAPIFGAEEIFRDFYEGKSEKELKKLLTKDSVIPFLFRSKNRKSSNSFLTCLVPGTGNWTVIVKNNTQPFCKFQMIHGKILHAGVKRMEVSLELSQVWNKDFQISLSFLDSYLISMRKLVARQNDILKLYNEEMYIGRHVTGVIDEVKQNHAIVLTEGGDMGIVRGKFEKGEKINGIVIWIDAPQQLLHISTRVSDNETQSCSVSENETARGKVALITDEVIILELLGQKQGEFAFFPRRRHLNDFAVNENVIEVGDVLKLFITRKNSNYLLGMDCRIVDLQQKIICKKSERKLKESVESLKRKLEMEKLERRKKRRLESETEKEIEVVDMKLCEKPKPNQNGNENMLPEVKEEKNSDDDEVFVSTGNGIPRLEYDDLEIKSEVDADDNIEKEKLLCSVENEEKIALSSSSESEDEIEIKNDENTKTFKVDFDWEVLNNNSLLSGTVFNKEESSSDDEDEESKGDKKKRKRLSGIEKKEKAKSEEERLRFIEERLMDAEREPETADDFDRAVLSNPNSSALWLKYMAFHIQGTEIEKARTVARRALNAISFRNEQEKLNIWIALLNLENMYGSEESLQRTLSEALLVNEPYKIHLHMLTIHGQSNKLHEMEKLGNFMLKKYKEMENIWCDVAGAYFAVGKVESARNVLQKALGIVQKNQHVPIISKFAHLENKYGSPERAQTLYESILASFPKRVDIWCCYVDMLIKSNHIELARQVLERATSQSLKPRKMKTLFKKFIAFEEVHGNKENVEKVREAAVEYVETVGNREV